MKYLVKFFVVTFLILICTHSIAEQKIVVLDFKFVLNNSKAGKGAQDYLQKTFKQNQKKFSDLEKELKKEENDLLGKKSTLSQEDYIKKADELRNKVNKYQADRRASLDKIAKQRADARAKIISKLEPLLEKYVEENNIALVIDKKNVVGGDTDLDITNAIVEKFNKELPSIKIE
tara:strand:+ start:132 stop:656 length:525 start_codon:yes stop_codon:yes gene_type:complete